MWLPLFTGLKAVDQVMILHNFTQLLRRNMPHHPTAMAIDKIHDNLPGFLIDHKLRISVVIVI